MTPRPGPQVWLRRRLGLEPGEGAPVVLMAALVATLLCGYTIAKVLRDSLFLAEFGALALPWAYVAVAVATVGFVALETRIGRRMPFGATRFTQFLAIGTSVVAPLTLHSYRHWTAAAFYVWTGSQAMMLLPHFWVLALDLWDTRRARRIFPVLAGFGLIGGLLGGAIARVSATTFGSSGLMWVLCGALVIALGLSRLAERYRRRPQRSMAVSSTLSSWAIFRQSRYIQLLVVVLTLSVVVATLVDFQFKFFVQRLYPESHAMTGFLGTFYVGLNLLALLFQFTVAGWILERLNLGVSTTLQPLALFGFAALATLSNGGWAVIAMRWLQGVMQQGLGKSSTEIYYGAIRPQERRRIKPAIDTLVERWADALVGVLLVIALHLLHVPVLMIGAGTAVLCVLWLVMLFALNRQYGRAFESALSSRWIGPDDAPETLRNPLARRALLRAIDANDPASIAVALPLARDLRGPTVNRAVRTCLRHESPLVRSAAIEAMASSGLADSDGTVLAALDDPSEAVQRSAVKYLVSRPQTPPDVVRRLLDGENATQRLYAVGALVESPSRALDLLTPEWIQQRIESGRTEDLLAAARALEVRTGPDADQALRRLLESPDVEIRRAALVAASRHPRSHLLFDMLPLLAVPELTFAARRAVAACGNAAVPTLAEKLEDAAMRGLVVHTLARIASPRAIATILPLARSSDPGLRSLGLEGLLRARSEAGRPVLTRRLAHRFFLRELHDYGEASEAARGLRAFKAPELRLLAESIAEIADQALDRAFWALACSYDPKPLFGAFERLKSGDLAALSPALEYLGHLLPRAVFRTLSRVVTPATDPVLATTEDVQRWILTAWESQDEWLRACAVRASIAVPGFDESIFASAPAHHDERHVLDEIAALAERRGATGLAPREAMGC